MPSVVAGIPARFNELLKEKGYDRPVDFVKATDLPKTTVYGMASGKTIPRLDTVELVCKNLGVNFLEFFSYAQEKKVEYEVQAGEKVDILEIYNQLNDHGKEKLNSYAAFLMSLEKQE